MWVIDFPKEAWPTEGDRLNWLNDEVGDRRQEIVFIQGGTNPMIDEAAIRRLLDACLLKPGEAPKAIGDKFPPWDPLPVALTARPPSGVNSIIDNNTKKTHLAQPNSVNHHGSRKGSAPEITTIVVSSGEKEDASTDAVLFVREMRKGAKEVLTECRKLSELVDAKALARAHRRESGNSDDGEEEFDDNGDDPETHMAFKNCVIITSRLVESIVLPFAKTNITQLGSAKEVSYPGFFYPDVFNNFHPATTPKRIK